MNIFVVNSYASSPLVIDINDGVKEIPFEVGDVDKDVTSSFVDTIISSDTQNSLTNLSDVIEKESGIKIRKSGGTGSHSLASIRGKSADQVMIYLDGVLLNTASGGGVDLSLIPLNQIASVEIYKDTIPVEFAEASNGGVINITTHRKSNVNQIQISNMVGSFGTSKSDIQADFSRTDFNYSLIFGHLKSTNDYLFPNENGTPDDSGNFTLEKKNNNQVAQYNFVIRAKKNIDLNQSLIVQSEGFFKEKGISPINNNNVQKSSVTNTSKNFKTNYINNSFVKNTSVHLGFSNNMKSLTFDNRDQGVWLIPSHTQYSTNNIESSFYIKLNKSHFQLTSNTVFRQETLSVDDFLGQYQNRTNKRYVFATALQTNLFKFNKRLLLTSAIRAQYTKDNISGLTLTGSGFNSSDKSAYTTYSPQVGVRYFVSGDFNLKFNASKYYRLPTYVELFGSQGYIGANEELVPESGVNTDFGFEYQNFPRSDKFTNIKWSGAAFLSTIDNEIIYSFNSRGEGRPNNTEHSIVKGIESRLSVEMFYNFILNTNFTLLSPFHFTASNHKYMLPGRPLASISSKLSYELPRTELYLEHIYDSEMYFDTVERQPADEKNIFNAGGTYSIKSLILNVSISNIFGNYYKDYYFQSSPGRSIQASIKYKFN